MSIFSKLQNLFRSSIEEQSTEYIYRTLSEEEKTSFLVSMREVGQNIPSWVGIINEYSPHIDDSFYGYLSYMIELAGISSEERESFIKVLSAWNHEMGYTQTSDIRSELEYRLHNLLGIEEKVEEENSLFGVIAKGLSKTRDVFTYKIHRLLSTTGELNEDFWEDMESIFLTSDVGYSATEYILEELRRRVRNKEEFLSVLESILEEIFTCERRLVMHTKPRIIMVIGINGAGKTTTIAKLAHIYKSRGEQVLLVAGDTFRAAAIEQLEIWSNRLGVGFFFKGHGSDSASVAFEGIEKAMAEGYDTVLIDTAGRLHTKTNLMEELSKIYRVIKKRVPEAPHSVILVLDATIGQNALTQTELFNKSCPVDEIIFTKLDGTAKGGVAISVALQYKIPITYIGLGETMDALQSFDAKQFTKALLE